MSENSDFKCTERCTSTEVQFASPIESATVNKGEKSRKIFRALKK